MIRGRHFFSAAAGFSDIKAGAPREKLIPIVQPVVVSGSIRLYDFLFSQEHERDACCGVCIQACDGRRLQSRLLQTVQLGRAGQQQPAANSYRIQTTGPDPAR
jgi:hypothetical protein